jgi:hypothetical protein
MEIKNNEFSRKFETSVEGKPLSIEYAIQERKLFLTKIIVPEGETLDNEVSEFIREVLKIATEKRLKVVPVHPKAAAFFRKNPTFKEMLPPGIRL